VARSVLEILINLKDRASGELKKVDKNLDKVEKSAKKSSKGIKGFNTDLLKMGAVIGGATAGVVAFGKALWDIGKRGAAVQQTEESFKGLLDQLGIAPSLLEDLRLASRGTVDDVTLMSGVLTLAAGTGEELSRAMIKATPDLMEMAKAANKLNPTLGDTNYMFQSITEGIKRNSKQVLDNLGIVFSAETAYTDYAESINKTVDELDDTDRAMAFLEATMKAGGNLIDQVGGTVEAAGDSMARMEIKVQNLKDELARGFAPVVEDAAETVIPLVSAVSDFVQVESELKRALEKNLITQEEYNRMMQEHMRLQLDLADVQKIIIERTEVQTEREQELRDAYSDSASIIEGYIKEQLALKDTTGELADKQRELKGTLSELQLWISGPIGAEIDRFEDEKAAELESQVFMLSQQDTISPEQLEQLDTLKGRLAEVRGEIIKNQKAHEKAQKSIVFDLLTQQAAADDLTEAEMEGLTSVAEKWGLIDEETARVTKEVSKALGDIDKFQTSLDDVIEGLGISADTAVEESLVPLYETMMEMVGIHDIELRILVTGDPIPDLSGLGGGGRRPKPPPEYQHGGDFVVPPGGAFPMIVHPGEHVTVTPRGRGRGGTVTYSTNVVQHFYDEGAAALGLAVVRKGGRDRLNSSMGR
jgi:hypothetical protein